MRNASSLHFVVLQGGSLKLMHMGTLILGWRTSSVDVAVRLLLRLYYRLKAILKYNFHFV